VANSIVTLATSEGSQLIAFGLFLAAQTVTWTVILWDRAYSASARRNSDREQAELEAEQERVP